MFEMFVMLFIVLFYQVVVLLLTVVSSDVTIRLYRFRFDFSIQDSISIRFGFDFLMICTPVEPTGFVCGRVGTHNAAVLATHEAITPPLPSASA